MVVVVVVVTVVVAAAGVEVVAVTGVGALVRVMNKATRTFEETIKCTKPSLALGGCSKLRLMVTALQQPSLLVISFRCNLATI